MWTIVKSNPIGTRDPVDNSTGTVRTNLGENLKSTDHLESDRVSRGAAARPPSSDRESGLAIIISLFFVLIIGGLVASGTLLMRAGNTSVEIRYRREAQAVQFAKSGLTEALHWLRRQTGQPVTDFKPLRDTAANPQVLDTDDPMIGLVRDFQIAGDVWGRYEVWREDETDSDLVRLDFRRKYQMVDLSIERGFSGSGNVWLVRSIGYIYQKLDLLTAWDQKPNRILASSTLECESQRLSLQPPAQAAVSIDRGNNLKVKTKGRVRGGAVGAGVYYPTGTGTPRDGPAAANRITGTPDLSASPDYKDSVKDVFGVTRDELRAMADFVITDPNDFPDPVPDFSIVFVECPTITFDLARSLNGTAAVYIDSNVTLLPGNDSSFNGLLYVDGNFTMRQKSDIYGAVVCTGNMTLRGSADYATIWYDDEVLKSIRRAIGVYRWSSAFRSVINTE